MNENIFDKLDFGPFRALLDNDDITDISFDNNGQIWVRSLTQGSLRVEVTGATPEFVEKLAFQCSNVMGTTFNNAKPFLDAESAELRLNFVHPSIATNGIAMVIRKTPAKIRLEKEKLIKDDYFTRDIHDVLIKCVEGHCNIIVSGETGSGKTEFVKYLASHTKVNEKIITIEDTLELHLDKIFPQRDIVAMKTNNVASYTDVLVTCMRQNPKWILLSEVRSAEAVSAVRNSISSGHNILSTIHADKASAIPYRLYSLMETDLDVNQFLSTIYRYIQLGVHIRAYYSKERGKFHREVDEVVEFYVDENNQPQSRIIYQKVFGKEPILRKPSKHLLDYLENQNIDITAVTSHMSDDVPFSDDEEPNNTNNTVVENTTNEEIPAVNQVVPTDTTIVNSSEQVPVGSEVQSVIPASMVIEQQPVEEENVNVPLSAITEEVQSAMPQYNQVINTNVVQDSLPVNNQVPSQAMVEGQVIPNFNQTIAPQAPVIPPQSMNYQPQEQVIQMPSQEMPLNQQVYSTPIAEQNVMPIPQVVIPEVPHDAINMGQNYINQGVVGQPEGVLPYIPPIDNNQEA